MAEIVGIGCAVFDMMLKLSRFPEEDEKFPAEESKVQCGGPCAVAMITAAKQGVSSAYMGKFGDDLYGLGAKSCLEKYGVDLSSVRIMEGGQTQLSIVLSNQSNGKRTCIVGSAASPELRMSSEDVDLSLIRGAKYLHIDGKEYLPALYAAKKAHEMGIKVSMDLDWFAVEHTDLQALADILIPSENSAKIVAGTDDVYEAARILRDRFHPETLVITMGPEGGICMTDGEMKPYPAFQVDVIDSNGAGDVFHGAFLAAKVRGFSDYEAALHASASSALKCTHFGASEGAPSWDEAEEFLAKRRAEITGIQFPEVMPEQNKGDCV